MPFPKMPAPVGGYKPASGRVVMDAPESTRAPAKGKPKAAAKGKATKAMAVMADMMTAPKGGKNA